MTEKMREMLDRYLDVTKAAEDAARLAIALLTKVLPVGEAGRSRQEEIDVITRTVSAQVPNIRKVQIEVLAEHYTEVEVAALLAWAESDIGRRLREIRVTVEAAIMKRVEEVINPEIQRAIEAILGDSP